MRYGEVTSFDVIDSSYRLNGGFFLTEDEQAMRHLRRWSGQRASLEAVTQQVFSGPIFRKIVANRVEDGVGYVSAKDIFKAELVPKEALSYAHGALLEDLKLKEDTILLTCSGMNLGRSVWVRSDMAGLAGSGDLIRIVPDATKAPPGFVFAFVSSRFGITQVRKQIYGGHIRHVSPGNVAQISVPRLGDQLEERAHEAVLRAARLRTEANKKLALAKQAALELWGTGDLRPREAALDVRLASSSELALTRRLDASYYSSNALESDAMLTEISEGVVVTPLSSVAQEIFETTRFGRKTVEDPAYGVPFLSISDLVRFDPRTDSLVSTAQVDKVRARVKEGWLVLPRVGQINGVFGTVCLIPSQLDGIGVSDNNIRVVPKSPEDGAYLWAALSTRICYEQIIRRACGTSIPYLDATRVGQIPVPWPSSEQRATVATLVLDANRMRSEAVSAEDGARRIVESAIEEAS